MTEEEKKRMIDQIDQELVDTFRKRKECLVKDNVEEADRLTKRLMKLDSKKRDIDEGRFEIMEERRNYLLNKVDELNKEYASSGFLKKLMLKRKISEAYDSMNEYSLRKYAKGKVLEKTIDKK